MAEVAPADAAPVVVAPVAKEEVFAVAHIFASFNDTFVVSEYITCLSVSWIGEVT